MTNDHPKVWRAETGIFLIAWLLLMVGGRSSLFRDPGTLWHVVVGQHILADRQLPHEDAFSFTFGGQPWIAQWWLGECALAVIHLLSGLDSILLATATGLACLFAWMAHRLIRQGVHPLIAALVIALAALASSYHFHPRPHVVTIVLLAWTFARLCDFEAGRIPVVKLFCLIPAFVVWTNVHGGMVGGVATLALAVVGWTLARLLGMDSPILSYRQFFTLTCLILACALTALVNPYGLELSRVWFALLGSPVLPRLIEEHAPLMTGSGGWTVLLFALVYVITLVGISPRHWRVTWLIPLVWLALAWTRVRHGPLFAVTAAIALADLLPQARWLAWLARQGSVTCRIQPPPQIASSGVTAWKPALIPAALVLAAVLLQAANIHVPVLGRGWARLDAGHWPTDLLPELRAYAQSHADGTPVFNDMLFGGFLIYHTPGLRVFIDDRCELYGDEQLLRYAHAAFEDPAQVDHWQRQYGFDIALVRPGTPFDRYLQTASGWTLVGRTEAAALYRMGK